MDAYYATEEPLPLDINRICKMIRVSNRTEKRHVLAIIVQFFEQSPDGFRHHRIDREIAVYREKALINKANAKRPAKRNESQPLSETATKPVTTNQEPVTNIHIPPIAPQGGFDEFWNEYRLKVARPAAEKAFAKAIKRADLQTILAGVRQYNAFLVRNPTRAKAHPATWLNNERWNDQMEAGNEENRQHTQRYKPTKTDRLNAVLREALSPDFTGYGWPGRADADTGAVLSRPESVWEGTRTDEIHDSPSSNGAGPIPDRSGPRGLW